MASFDEPFPLDDLTLQVGASIGVASFPEHGTTMEALRKNADIAMYVAKRRGGGLAVFDSARDKPDLDRLTTLSELRTAIRDDQLELHYQPIIDLASGNTRSLEALVRWNHPTRGLLGPTEFISLAEVSGLIRPLTRWVLDRALADVSQLHRSGFEPDLSVNISVRNLFEPHFVDEVEGALQRHSVGPSSLKLEITETQVMDDPKLADAVLGRLGQLGVAGSVDDFGTGHSSLSNLQSLPISEIKIDRSFVAQMSESDSAATIVRSIVALGHNLGLTVVAEGVETNEHLTTLSLLGCDAAQGYHLARPLSFEQVTAHMERYPAPTQLV